MKKMIVCIIIIVAIIALGCFALNKNLEENEIKEQNIVKNEEVSGSAENTNIKIDSAEDLTTFIDELYKGNEELYPSLMSQTIDITDSENVSYMTGLENGNDLEYLVVSEPMMSSQAYSLVIGKVKEGSNANDIAKKMSENINMRKWICVSAEVLYATSTQDLVFLVMASDKMATPVYNEFKNKVGTIGEEFKRAEVVEELPEDMY